MLQTERVHLRWMIRRDLPEVLATEAWLPEPWSEDDWLGRLRHRNCIAMVAEVGDRAAGAVLYELHKGHLRVTRLAVHPACRGRGVGRAILEKIAYKVGSHRRPVAVADVPQGELGVQVPMRSCGWRATKVLEGIDCYRFECRPG